MPRRSTRVLTHERFKRVVPDDPHYRELVAVREILHGFLSTDASADAFQFALDRVSPLLGASFASVFLIDGASELMKLAAAHRWPARFRPWLAGMRVRVGFGPSGEAAAERRIIEVPDVTGEGALEDWAEVAQELGFKSLVALPLQAAGGVLGAVTFYFAEPGRPTDERRSLMRIVADQMAGAAQRARLADDLRRANAALSDANAELERQYGAVREARRSRDEFLADISDDLRRPLGEILHGVGTLEPGGPRTSAAADATALIRRAAEELEASVDALVELSDVQRGVTPLLAGAFDPSEPIGTAVAHARSHWPGLAVERLPGPELPPVIRSDGARVSRILVCVLRAVRGAAGEGASAVIGYTIEGGRVEYRVSVRGAGPDGPLGSLGVPAAVGGTRWRTVGLSLAGRLARLLGGDLALRGDEAVGHVLVLELPIEYDSVSDQGA